MTVEKEYGLVWNDKYVIGISEIDGQHKILAGLINQLGLILTNKSDVAEVRAVLDELARYTQYHFETEEKLMEQYQINAVTSNIHCKAHEQFRRQITLVAQTVEQTPHLSDHLARQLLEYLTQWLVHHIMGNDMRMAREIQALQAGASHKDASKQATISSTFFSEASPAKLLATLMLAVFSIEWMVMIIFSLLPSIPGWLENILDSFILTSLLFPMLYYLVFLPLNRSIAEQTQAKNELVENRDYLEEIVFKQTAELIAANGKMRQDLTELKQAELTLQREKEAQRSLIKKLEDTQNQLMQADKLASIGQLAAGVAHEINNPIGYVNSNLGTLEVYVRDIFSLLDIYQQAESAIADGELRAGLQAAKQKLDIAFLKEDLRSLMSESKDGITRVKTIVQSLKDFAHADVVDEWRYADLRHGLDSTLNIVNNEIKYKADVIKEYGDIPEVECLPAQLNQVFMNLLVNAVHAIEQHGTITIRTGQQNDEVYVEISDTGKGIAPECMQKIFDPFFTTKPIGKGTGLGLSLSYGIVQKHHGRIDVKSELGKGSTFKVWLPVYHINQEQP